MDFLPKVLGIVYILFFLALPREATAVTIAQQTDDYSNSSFIVWQALQELGNSLSGPVGSFTFRVQTARSNSNQFNYTALNTRIYDKDADSAIIARGCVPNSSDPLAGLNFTTAGIPAGYEDVTIDFSCNNYSFIQGHKYLIFITNANMGNSGSGQIMFATTAYGSSNTDYFSEGGIRYGNGNRYDYSNNSGSCDPVTYRWGRTDPWGNGCYAFTSSRDDLYFTLTNTLPPPRLPVVFIPGIGGSEMKAADMIPWVDRDNGHGGTFSHAYAKDEKIWVNQNEAAGLGDDDYFDVLKLKADGVTAEASLDLTGNLTSFSYGDIEPFFTGMGYVKGTNFFVFNYDWRKDVRSSKDALDALIETTKTASGQSQVNLVVHSMGGLIARYYISDAAKAAKVNKLIELGVPHLGAVDSLKSVMHGIALKSRIFGILPLGIPSSEIKDISQNQPSIFQLLPSNQYFNFYNNSDKDHPYPFRDDRDIDNNQTTGDLNYDQTKSLFSNLSYNMTVFGLGEEFHNSVDSTLNQTNGVKIYEIVGTGQPTLGQIRETWWINWPVNLIPKQDEIFINGDDTVPLYSASLKNDSTDLSGTTKLYYVDQKHTDLVSQNGTAMQTVKSILNDDNALPSDASDQKILLEGQEISVDGDVNLDLYDDQGNHTGINSNGDVETNISDTYYDSLGRSKYMFVKKKAAKKPKAKITASKTTKAKVKIRTYSADSITKTAYYADVPVTTSDPVEFTIEPTSQTSPALTSGTQTITASAEETESSSLDQTPPQTTIEITGTKNGSGIYSGPVTVTLTAADSGSGILKIEYSLDNGLTVQTYSDPFTVSTEGKTILQVKAVDNLGNEEIPQEITIEIAPTSASVSSSSSDSTGGTSSSTQNTSEESKPTSKVNSSVSPASPTQSSAAVLGIEFKNPHHISDEINITHLLEEKSPVIKTGNQPSAREILNGLILVSGAVVALASLGLAGTFLIHPPPK